MTNTSVKGMAAQSIITKRTNEELIRDWKVLDTDTAKNGITVEKATVRGWLMDEIEKRFPVEFDRWLENCANDDNIENYIKLGAV